MIELSRYGAYQVKMPLPFRLDHVNCYAFRGEAGWVLLDTGLNYGPTRQAWMEFMAEHGIRPENIAGIYITHYHPDHYGAAGWLQEISGAPVYMSDVEISLAEKIWREDTVALMMEMLSENGVPAGVGVQIMAGVAEMRNRIKPHPRLTPLAAGETVHLGALRCRVLLTPGHSDGHVCFYDEENGFLFSGDHLLPRISSNISLWPRSHPDPLANFLASLAETSRLPAKMVLPAHGEYFAGVPGRVAELQAHHRERLELIRRIASRGANAYQVCREVFGDGLSLHEVRFALTETLAHLVYLEKRGLLKTERVDGVFFYTGRKDQDQEEEEER